MVTMRLLILLITMLFARGVHSAIVECDRVESSLGSFKFYNFKFNYEFNNIRFVDKCGSGYVIGDIVNFPGGLNVEATFDFTSDADGYVLHDIEGFGICLHHGDCENYIHVDKSIFESYGENFIVDMYRVVKEAYLNDGKGFIGMFSPGMSGFWLYFNKDYRVMIDSLKKLLSKDIYHLSLAEKEVYDESGAVLAVYLSLGIYVEGRIYFVYFSVSGSDFYPIFEKFSVAIV